MPLHTNHEPARFLPVPQLEVGSVVTPSALPASFSIALVRGADLQNDAELTARSRADPFFRASCMAWAEPIPTEAHAATRNHEAHQ